MRTLLIDNYDSYTFNLYQQLASVNGIEPIVIKNDLENWADYLTPDITNIVISPGPGHPKNREDFGICSQVIQQSNIPVLGVCLGHQGIGTVFGSRVIHAPDVCHGRLSSIHHCVLDLFEGIPSPFTAVRYHSLVVDRPSLPSCLQITAETEDGIIMGLRHRHRPIFGVQFHPESICTDYGDRLLKNFQTITLAFHQTPVSLPVNSSATIPQAKTKLTFIPKPKTPFNVFVKKVSTMPEPEQVFVHFYGASSDAFWLDSSQVETGLSRFSFMGDAQGDRSLKVSYNCLQDQIEITKDSQTSYQPGNIFDFLQQKLDHLACTNDQLPFDFNCGFVGYLGYELKRDCDASFAHSSSLPDAVFLLATQLLVFDHQQQIMYLLYLGQWDEKDAAQAWFNSILNQLASLPPLPPITSNDNQKPVIFRFSQSRTTYLKNIHQCLEEIRNGESYEICLTNCLHTDTTVDPLAFYRHLRHLNPAPYACFLRFGDFAVVCSSPERFLKIDGDRQVETKPIKGTRPRGQTPEDDQSKRLDLRQNEKERAENLMVLDLLRNDLGRVCTVGSIHVPQLMQVETYATVHQLVSTIRGQLRPDVTITDCIRAAFPGGSMTGAPKLRTMEIIDQLEGEARGIYSGAIGFLGLNGTADLNIVIRSAIVTAMGVSIGTGGGIVALSEPELEFEEILLKVRALIHALVKTVHGNPSLEHYHIDLS
ncbi:MAG: aminodeoxychorismate synthase component I [Cyanothece sp. SIO2G6]|nr:aminodeoxychorismate synthase component I [Cyanothece sp. SIO2G6]